MNQPVVPSFPRKRESSRRKGLKSLFGLDSRVRGNDVQKSASGKSPQLVRVATYLVAAILALVPFHALLSVWLGSAYGIYDATRLWEEVLLAALAVPVGILLWQDASLRKNLFAWLVIWLAVGYAGLHVVVGLVAWQTGQVGVKALLYGVLVNLRPAVFLLFCLVVAARSPWLKAHWQQLVFIPAAIVVGFGL